MRLVKSLGLLAVGLASVLWLAQPAGAEERLRLTLEQAIDRSLQKSEDILVERAARDAAAAAVEGAEGAYDPLLGLSAGYRHSVEPVNSSFSGAPEGEPAPTNERLDGSATVSRLLRSGAQFSVRALSSRATTNGAFGLLSPAYGSQLGVEFRQPLLRDRAVDPARLTVRVAAADRDGAIAALRRQVRDTVVAVERAYWSLAAQYRAVEVAEETVELAEEQLEQTRLRIESGITPETEISQPRAELERRRGDLLAFREARSRAENELKLLILGDDEASLWSGVLEPVDDVAIAAGAIDVTAAMDRALATRVELAIAESFIERRQAERAFAVDRVRPSLDLVLGYDRFGLTGARNPAASSIPGLDTAVPAELDGGWGSSLGALADGDFDDARIAVELGVPIGNRAARANVEIARAVERQALAELGRVRKIIRADVLDAAAAVETARGRIEAAGAAREAAAVQLSSERDRFDAGLSTNFLVLTRQNDLAGARLAEIQARTDYRTARVDLARATGSLLEERGIEVLER